MTTLTYTGELVVEVCWCGIQHAVPKSLVDHQRAQHDRGEAQVSIYCPLGHGWIRGGPSDTEKERRRRERAETRERALRDQLDASERSKRALRGSITKMKKRAANGVCPCCTRSFADLQRHMSAKHPGYAQET